MIAAVTLHYQYADGGYLTLLAITNWLGWPAFLNRRLPRSSASISAGIRMLSDICADSTLLLAALTVPNQEFAAYQLFDAKPADEGDREDDV